jgi:cysteine-rich repeat protein
VGELCDDGNTADDDGCSGDCQTDYSCPNGVQDPGEECDTGGDSETCNVDCTLAECGDSYHNSAAGEECDDGGNSVECDADCTLVSCGDGYRNNLVEICDDGGDSAICDGDCTPAACPDGYLNPEAGEECDDGNGDNGDGCSIDCKLE